MKAAVLFLNSEVRDLLPPHHGGSKIFGKSLAIAERSFLGVYVDHGHGLSPLIMTIVIGAKASLC
jgi:hypothetical protein